MSGFFKKFKSIPYALDGYSKDAMNLLTGVIVKRLRIDHTFVYQRYVVPEGTTPEALANELYDNPDLGWVLLLVNGCVNPFTDWAMDSFVLRELIDARGGADRIIAFRDLTNGYLVDDVDMELFMGLWESGQPLPANISPVTAYDEANDRNRLNGEIVVVSPKLINQFVDMFQKVVEGKDAD